MGDKPARNRLKHAFRARALQDRERFYNDIADCAEASLWQHDLKSVYRSIKKICGGPGNSHSHPISKADGSLCQSDDEVLERWNEHYETALNHPPSSSPHGGAKGHSDLTSGDGGVPTDAPTLKEVNTAVGRLKNGKLAGFDGITTELLNHSIDSSGPALHNLFCRVWVTGSVPADWRDGIIIFLYKGKGRQSECGSYRPITILSVPGKALAHILLAQIQPLLISKRKPQQSVFTPGRSTSEAVLALRLLSDLHREFSQPLYVAYVNLKPAFDSVDKEALWKTIGGTGTPESLLNLIRDLLQGSNSQIRVGSRLSPSFPTGSGVRQGCVLAPALFCRAMNWILEETFSHSGLSVPYHHVTDIDFADDIATMDRSQAVLADTLQRMEGTCSALGLHISYAKTNMPNIGGAPWQRILLWGTRRHRGCRNSCISVVR